MLHWTWRHRSRSFVSLSCWTLAVDLPRSTVVLYRPIGRRLAFAPGHASSCTQAYGWFSLAAAAFGRSAIRTWLCLVVYCWRHPFVLFNEDAFLCDPAKKKKKLIDFYGPFPARGGGGVRPNPRTPYCYAPEWGPGEWLYTCCSAARHAALTWPDPGTTRLHG